MSWHDQLLARAMMRLPDRVTGLPPLLPERGHELECFREDLAHLDPQASDFATALEHALEETERLEGRKGRTPLWARCLGDHLVALYPEDWNGHGLLGAERRQLCPRVVGVRTNQPAMSGAPRIDRMASSCGWPVAQGPVRDRLDLDALIEAWKT
jgi:hypothetical protein